MSQVRSGVTKPAPAASSDPAVVRRMSRQAYGQSVAAIEAAFTALIEGAAGDEDLDDIGAPRKPRGRRQS